MCCCRNLNSCSICKCQFSRGSSEQHIQGIQHQRQLLSVRELGTPGRFITSVFENVTCKSSRIPLWFMLRASWQRAIREAFHQFYDVWKPLPHHLLMFGRSLCIFSAAGENDTFRKRNRKSRPLHDRVREADPDLDDLGVEDWLLDLQQIALKVRWPHNQACLRQHYLHEVSTCNIN